MYSMMLTPAARRESSSHVCPHAFFLEREIPAVGQVRLRGDKLVLGTLLVDLKHHLRQAAPSSNEYSRFSKRLKLAAPKLNVGMH
jgi:hypothetical protein